jgi:hypothetical protein
VGTGLLAAAAVPNGERGSGLHPPPAKRQRYEEHHHRVGHSLTVGNHGNVAGRPLDAITDIPLVHELIAAVDRMERLVPVLEALVVRQLASQKLFEAAAHQLSRVAAVTAGDAGVDSSKFGASTFGKFDGHVQLSPAMSHFNVFLHMAGTCLQSCHHSCGPAEAVNQTTFVWDSC